MKGSLHVAAWVAARVAFLLFLLPSPGCNRRDEVGKDYRGDSGHELDGRPGRVGDERDLDCSGLPLSKCRERREGQAG